jgi:FkbM family methyltransferase
MSLKELVKAILKRFGFDLSRSKRDVAIGSDKRPTGRMDFLLEDLKFRGLQCNTIVDVGANCASWSNLAKAIFPTSAFCLIEPQVEMQAQLAAFCAQTNNSHYFLAGAGSKHETLTLTIWDDLSGSSFLVTPDKKLKENGKQREVEIITIDDLIKQEIIGMPELIKLDIQGFELEALRGAESTFGHTEAYILEVSLFSFSEVQAHPIFSDVINFMLERGYVIYDFAGFSRRPLDGALAQCDICFVKQNGFLRKSNYWT